MIVYVVIPINALFAVVNGRKIDNKQEVDMENVKYIPGDLVMTNGVPMGTYKDVVYEVSESYPNKKFIFDGTINKGVVTLDAITEEDKAHFVETSTWVKHIVPVPLTPQILVANGWKLDGGQYVFKFRPCGGTEVELIGFFIEMFKEAHDMLKYKYFQITHENKVICGCFYCHQLQHLLFGLGLSSELKI